MRHYISAATMHVCLARLLCLIYLMLVPQAWADPAPAKPFQDPLADGGMGPVMQPIPAGDFVMGAPPREVGRFPWEGPTHVVSIKKPFAIGRYEVTFAEYDRFAAATGRQKPSDKGWGVKHWGRGKMPVFNVTWHDAKAYVAWLSQQTKHPYRLASEAEWEYAARAGSNKPFTSGDCINTAVANYHGWYKHGDCPISELYRGKTVEVGSFPPNAWGLFDVQGNIFEWTEDCWHESYDGAPRDGTAWLKQGSETEWDEETVAKADCGRRVLRGGSWSGRPRDIRVSQRSKNFADFKSIFIGFRVVRDF